MVSNHEFLYWRRIWQITSGNLRNATNEETMQNLHEVRLELLYGVMMYDNSKPYKDIIDKHRWNDDVERFITRAANYLNVDLYTSWHILKSYMLNEYCGSLKTIQNLKYEMQIQPMLNNIWKFYTSERLYMLKTLKNLIEFMNDTEHPLHAMYKEYGEQIGFCNLWQACLAQFKYLIGEIRGEISDKNLLKLWVERNIRETIEMVQCLIMLTPYVNVSLKDFHEVLVCCKMHGFGREPAIFGGLSVVDADSENRVTFTEVALLLCIGNQLWTRSNKDWYEDSPEMHSNISPLAYREEHGAVCYIWTMIHMVLENSDELYASNFHKLLSQAISLNCFGFFEQMVTNEMFISASCLVGASVHEALFNMLAISCKNFDEGGQMLGYPGVVPLAHVLLKNLPLAERFFREFRDADGHISLWSTAVELHPYNIEYLSKLSEAVISSNCSFVPKVLNDLCHLPWYTEVYNPTEIHHKPRRQNLDCIILESSYTPENNPEITFPPNFEVTLRQWKGDILAHFPCELNYWLILNRIIKSTVESSIVDTTMIANTTAGLRVVLAIFKVEKDAIRKYPFLMNITLSVFSILNRYCCTDNPPFTLLIVCMDICTELLHKYRMFVATQMEGIFLLPRLTKVEFTYDDIFKINFLEMGKIGSLIIQSRRHLEQHLVLMSYVKFLRTSFLLCNGTFNIIELPGLVFILKEIFPHFMVWYSKREIVYQDILYQCIHYVFEMFQFTTDKVITDQHRRMRKLSYQCFVSETCGRCLLRILYVGNMGLQYIMEGQTNWQSGRGIRYISVIQKTMAILMQLLTERKSVTGVNTMTPLEHLIYSENNSVRTVQAIASFLNHPFNDAIPNLACRLLKKFTIELEMSMLAALDLEPDQVRSMFIHRLRDRLECDNLKLAIIELISASIPKQPGMTEAFFKVAENVGTMSILETNSTSGSGCNEGIGSFVVEYLNTFSSDDKEIDNLNPLLSRIMQLLHVLWMNQKEILIADIMKDGHFWPSLCCPLFRTITYSNKTYSEILNIIGKEIHKKGGNIDETLKDVISKLLSTDSPYIDRWLNHIYNACPTDTIMITDVHDDTVLASCLVLSWKDFLIITAKFLPTLFSNEVKIKLVEKCKITLKDQYFQCDNCLLTFTAELYVFLMCNWGEFFFTECRTFYEDIAKIMQNVSISYQTLPKRLQEAALAISVLSLRNVKLSSQIDKVSSKSLMESVGTIFNIEYDIFMDKYERKIFENTGYSNKEQKSFLMCFEALSEAIELQTSVVKEYNKWCLHSRLICKLIRCVNMFLDNMSTFPMTKCALETLIHYANSPNVIDFLHSDISLILWEKIQPKPKYRRPTQVGLNILQWDLIEWWIIYKRLITLLTILLKKHGHFFIKEILMFVSLHEEYLSDVLLLERYSVDVNVLNLISSILVFMYELLAFEKTWRDDHEQSFNYILDTIKMTLNCSSAVIVRPNVLKYHALKSLQSLEENINFDFLPTYLIVDIINRLTDIVHLATMCILRFCPPIFAMLTDNTDYSPWTLQIGTSFGLPALGVDASSELTFGSLICTACVYVRTLQQINNSKKISQVTSPREILVARKSRLTSYSSTLRTDDPKYKGDSKFSVEHMSIPSEAVPMIISNVELMSIAEHNSQLSFTQIQNLAGKQSSVVNAKGFVRIDYQNPLCTIANVPNFAAYSSPINTFPWLAKLNEEKTTRALEAVLTMLTSQVSLVLRMDSLIEREEKLIKRELYSELQTFHDFINKRFGEMYRYSSSDRNTFVRKKDGLLDDEEPTTVEPKKATQNSSIKRTLNVTTLYTNVKFTKNVTNQPIIESPSCNEAKIDKSTSEVRLLSEDYLHFLSLWFTYVLHNNNDK